jgi:hypothetical protein
MVATKKIKLNFDLDRSFVTQMQKYVRNNAKELKNCFYVGVGDDTLISILLLATIENIGTLPKISLPGDGLSEVEFDADFYRRQVVKPGIEQLPHGSAYPYLTVLNGSGLDLSITQLQELARFFDVNYQEIRVFDVSIQNQGMDIPAEHMLEKLLSVGLSSEDIKHPEAIIYNPSAVPTEGVLMALTIYGLLGVWPQIARISQINDVPVVAEVIRPYEMWPDLSLLKN